MIVSEFGVGHAAEEDARVHDGRREHNRALVRVVLAAHRHSVHMGIH